MNHHSLRLIIINHCLTRGTTLLLRLSGASREPSAPGEAPNQAQAVAWRVGSLLNLRTDLDQSVWRLGKSLEVGGRFPSLVSEESFLALMGRKRLCVLRFLGPTGGTLRLIPKKDEAEAGHRGTLGRGPGPTPGLRSR